MKTLLPLLSFPLGMLLCGQAHVASAADAVADSAVPVPSSYGNDDLQKNASPPAGPLPDPINSACSSEDDTDGSCISPAAEGPSSSSSSPAATSAAIPTGKIFCPGDIEHNSEYDIYSRPKCFTDHPILPVHSAGEFVTPTLRPGEVTPILWRSNGKILSQFAVQVGLPPGLRTELLKYCDELGITDKFREYTSTNPIPAIDGMHNGEFVKFSDGNSWYAQRPKKEWESNMHWISPADEKTHEEYLRVLAKGGFDTVLDGLGKALGLDGAVAYQLTFIGVSYSDRGFRHTDSKETSGGVYNVIIPLLMEDDVPPELELWDDNFEEESEDNLIGGYKYHTNVAACMGDSVEHATMECDYRNSSHAKHGGFNEDGKRIGMRMAATVYIAEVYAENVVQIADDTLTQVFPLRDETWLLAQEGRHWQRESYQGYRYNRLVGDAGRHAYRVIDNDDGCDEFAKEVGCENDDEMRKKCPWSCKLYIEEGISTVERVDGTNKVNLCALNRTGIEECKIFEDNTDIPGDFITPNLEPGEMFPIVWRTDVKKATDYAFQIGLPPELTSALLEYCEKLGIIDALEELTGDDPLEVSHDGPTHDFFEFSDGNEWFVQRPPKKWTSNMHWISPADEKTHEEYLDVLAKGNFDAVLGAIGRYLGMEGLVAYHLTFIGVNHSEKGFMHRDTHHTGGNVYNIIIPLLLDEDALPELVMSDDSDENRKGALKYKIGTGAMMGDDAMHGTEACDYREKEGMRLAATIYIADLNDENAQKVADQTLTQIFPLAFAMWLMSQAGRHWGNGASMMTEGGRKQFDFRDHLSDCVERVEKNMCIDDPEWTRKKCLKSCKIYEPNGSVEETPVPEFSFDFETFEPGQYIDEFISSLKDNSCIDDGDEDCAELAGSGKCLTDMNGMEKAGCYRSCMYCLDRDMRDMVHLGENQILEDEEDDTEEEERPSPSDVAEVFARSEYYFVHEMLSFEDHPEYRLACQNFDTRCSYWAAQGECETNPGYMGKNCPIACRDCAQVDLNVRCPINEENNSIQPGDINKMFESWLGEAGEDVSSFSKDNLPTGGKHRFGEISVIRSPYHDMMQFKKDDWDEDEIDTFTPIPWVISIDGFLSDEECDRLIEFGAAEGYERSTEYADDNNVDGSAKYIEAEGRTSSNTFCSEDCDNDDIVKAVIQRMEDMTKLPKENHERLQLVKYDDGEFYELHHDFSAVHTRHQYGPRILTFFFYLNDKTSGLEGGGGTKFDELDFSVEPKRGMALVWPSVIDSRPEEMDDWTWHQALPVKGVKYGANTWMHLRDFRNTPSYCA